MSSNIKQYILAFLQEQNYKKSEKERKALEKATSDAEIAQLSESIREFDEKYRFDNWVANAANVMAKQLQFGTHIAKGIHPDAKGDNVTFQVEADLSNQYVGSQSAINLVLDANGNAAALPLAAFFNIIVDEQKQLKLRDLLLSDDPRLIGCFSDDLALSEQYKQQFQQALKGDLTQPSTHERNKQLLWVNSENAIEDDDYTCLIPLYPSSLTHAFYQKINQNRYSEQNKQARENRYKKTSEQVSYLSINQLVTVVLGGSKPQNISQLMSAQGGRNYLLPSLPPIMSFSGQFKITKSQNTIFNDRLAYACRYGLRQLYEVIKNKKNIYQVRGSRLDALNIILRTFLFHASLYQRLPAGWSKEYQLNMHEKYWLDPKRAELVEEEAFRTEREKGDWVAEVERSFALWLNECLKRRFPKLKHDFADAEYNEWRRNIRRSLRYRLRHS
ncbi:type I-F CRISPR-associated protein Csy1 [Pasteurella canis]|uniref:type I-F CRISPR-associated protein Csy1 n=1 Tax=Pasteurella canis TaxID=753 RepID=UPI000D9A66FF|nr:type I-F CRISPR-associated protein Csy1 [Pasteurella canis]SPY38532.1 CRISPR-associated protein, Csy1 family [Pasteurella canis]